MIIYAIDDEDNAREYLEAKIKEAQPQADVRTFSSGEAALETMKTEPFDVAFMDIQMPGLTGVELAKKIKKINPKSNIIFVTGYSEYMMDAFNLDASGYLLKPVIASQIKHALENLRYPTETLSQQYVTANCFGNFEVFFKGVPIKFKYNKSKEVVAFLIDRKGAVCSNSEVIINLWEDDDNHNSYYRSLVKDIIDTFTSLGCKEVISHKRDGLSIIPEKIKCDYYDFCAGKPAGINAFKGEYMTQYSWAEETVGLLLEDY